LIYVALDDVSRKNEGKIQRTRGKGRNIIRKKSKDKTCKNLDPFVLCVLLLVLAVLKGNRIKHTHCS
jgi:hypothetical protein